MTFGKTSFCNPSDVLAVVHSKKDENYTGDSLYIYIYNIYYNILYIYIYLTIDFVNVDEQSDFHLVRFADGRDLGSHLCRR